jgi:LPS sulfotransferase NodH
MNDIISKAKMINELLPVASNRMSAIDILVSRIQSALNPQLRQKSEDFGRLKKSVEMGNTANNDEISNIFDHPIFIVAAPRSGSTLLFESLARNRELWTIGGESHQIIEGIESLNPANNGHQSNRLTATDATNSIKISLRNAFFAMLQDSDGRLLASYRQEVKPELIRFLEKTPKNALRIPFIKAVFPDALFVFLHRSPRENISSIIDAWRSGKFVTYRKLSGWEAGDWSLLLPPGWKDLNRCPVNKIAAFQWSSANKQILEDLSNLSTNEWISVSYEKFLADPAATAKRICEFAQIPFGPRMQALSGEKLPNSRHTLTPPDTNKWRKNESEIMEVIADVEPLAEQLAALQN